MRVACPDLSACAEHPAAGLEAEAMQAATHQGPRSTSQPFGHKAQAPPLRCNNSAATPRGSLRHSAAVTRQSSLNIRKCDVCHFVARQQRADLHVPLPKARTTIPVSWGAPKIVASTALDPVWVPQHLDVATALSPRNMLAIVPHTLRRVGALLLMCALRQRPKLYGIKRSSSAGHGQPRPFLSARSPADRLHLRALQPGPHPTTTCREGHQSWVNDAWATGSAGNKRKAS